MRFALAVSIALVSVTTDALAKESLTFENDIRPIFRQHCFDCHGAKKEKEGELDLRQVRLMLSGGDSGAALTPGAADESLFLKRIVDGEMPPGDHRVPPEQVAILRQWVNDGAKTSRAEPHDIGPGLGISAEERAFWFFQPIHRPDVPPVQNAHQVQTPIDAFLLSQMEPEELTFSQDAERHTLIRRAYLDLIGLLPTPDEVDAFVRDDSPIAWEELVDRLLESKQYGERWGRHWLDVAGYADSEGGMRDDVRPWAYKYRDWVIRSFNDGMPFDQFITWQLAGDELAERPFRNMSQRNIDKLVATGFLRMAADGTVSKNDDETRNQVVADTIKIVSSSLLGLSVGCAQCHDHRYDPISQLDYFRMRAVFEPALNYKDWQTPDARRVSLYTDEQIAAAAEIEKQATEKEAARNTKQTEFMDAALKAELEKFAEDLRPQLENAYRTPANERTPYQAALLKQHPSIGNLHPGVLYQYNQKAADELKKLSEEIATIRSKKPPQQFVRALTEKTKETVPTTFLFHRGDFRQPLDAVSPGGLTAASPEDSPFRITDAESKDSSRRRLAYARWLTSGRHPLVARVLMNRVWLNHFGQTFVSTPDEFGKLGALPTHPELLDWLADEFMRSGWSIFRSSVWKLKPFATQS
ncbi:MAG: DUF1549 domain-containing protein [Planctomycetales bacterium]|nr:DUF1549 domain-containing protein [Planctomycetales bacterium]